MIDKYRLSGLFYEDFQKIINKQQTGLYFLENERKSQVVITNYGARIVSLIVPDKNGDMTDVVLGFRTLDGYIHDDAYLGAVCGRTANRIAKGQFKLEGKEYKLATNNGPNSLHGGLTGFNAVVWDIVNQSKNSIELSHMSKDGEEGFPGNLSINVTYTLTNDNSLDIKYRASTDKTTILNITNHSYFNLSGEGDSNVGDHIIQLNAGYYLPTDETAIPYGNPETVVNTPMDFTNPFSIGERIDNEFQQLIFAKGYDHNFILNKKESDEYVHAGFCKSPKTGIKMDIYTSQPGIQIYTANWLNIKEEAKNNHHYGERSAVCFETQHYPDSINNPEYPSVILQPQQLFEERTSYKFTIE